MCETLPCAKLRHNPGGYRVIQRDRACVAYYGCSELGEGSPSKEPLGVILSGFFLWSEAHFGAHQRASSLIR
jgi:hypothetical protein